MSINITPKEFQRRMIGAANRHHAAMQGMTDNEAASYVRASSRPRSSHSASTHAPGQHRVSRDRDGTRPRRHGARRLNQIWRLEEENHD
jgi:hypothetical protein